MVQAKKTIRKLENQLIARANSAFAAAYKKTLSSGRSVVISENGFIYRVFPDGTRKLLKKIEPPTRVKRGLKVHIR